MNSPHVTRSYAAIPEACTRAVALLLRDTVNEKKPPDDGSRPAATTLKKGPRMTPAQNSVYTTNNVLTALRELFSQHPEAAKSGPETLSKLLYLLRFLPYRPEIHAVEAALEALTLEGGIAA